MNIVIADHSARIRDQLKRFLEELPEPMIVGEASNSEEALTVIQDCNPEIVIFDFQILGSRGLAFIHQIKSMTAPPIIIVLTNLCGTEFRSACSQAGADYFLDKSLEFEKVPEIVKALSLRRNPSPGNPT